MSCRWYDDAGLPARLWCTYSERLHPSAASAVSLLHSGTRWHVALYFCRWPRAGQVGILSASFPHVLKPYISQLGNTCSFKTLSFGIWHLEYSFGICSHVYKSGLLLMAVSENQKVLCFESLISPSEISYQKPHSWLSKRLPYIRFSFEAKVYRGPNTLFCQLFAKCWWRWHQGVFTSVTVSGFLSRPLSFIQTREPSFFTLLRSLLQGSVS